MFQGNPLLRLLPRALAAVSLALTLASPPPARAQDFPTIERGFKPERVFQSGEIDNINLFNGGLTLALPLGQAYGIGLGSELTYRLSLHYNSPLWEYSSEAAPPEYYPVETWTWAEPARGFNAGFGWRLSLGEFWDNSRTGPDRGCGDCYVGPDGARHKFYPTLHEDVADDSADTFFTDDGTYLRWRKSLREIDFPNGEIHKFDSQGRLVQIRDRRGNSVNVSHGASSWTINDGVRTTTVNLVDVSHYGKAVGSVVLAAFGGTTATYTFSYTTVPLRRAAVDNHPQSSPNIVLPFLTGITLPDGSSYGLPLATSYHVWTLPGDSISSYPYPSYEGLIRELKLPTRGSLRWTWGQYEFPVPHAEEDIPASYTSWVAGVEKRQLLDSTGAVVGTWTYSQHLPGGWFATTSITSLSSPLGDRTDYYFKVGESLNELYGLPISAEETAPGRPDLLLSSKAYDCDATGAGCVLKRTQYLKYKTDRFVSFFVGNNPRVEASLTVFNDDGNRWSASDLSDFDGLGHYRTETLSGNFGAGDAKVLFTNYNPNRGTYPGSFTMPSTATPWVLGTYDRKSSSEGSKTFHSEYCFDPTTGFLNRVRTYASTFGSQGVNDVVTSFTRDAAASKIVERSYGGDLAPVGTGTLCSLALSDDSFRLDHTFQYGALKRSQSSTSTGAVVLIHVDRTLDANTGLATSETDPAGVQTSFTYDGMSRVTEIKPAEDAWVRYTYVAPVSANAAILFGTYNNGGFTKQITSEEVLLDDFGRAYRERRQMPTGAWARRTTVYDALSHVTDVSEWQADATNSAWTRYRNFDSFGRPGYVDPPEGPIHRVSFTYAGERQVSRTSKVGTALLDGNVAESSVTVTERRDRQGRLYQVVDGTGTTTYGYDPAGKLTSASLPGQSRLFHYDGRGFLQSEQLPEKGNGFVTYSRYSARGHVGTRADGPMSVDYLYDRAGRLTQVKEPGAAGLPIKVFVYGTGTSGADRSAGKVKTASRYNYVTLGLNPTTVEVRETYTYGGRSGRTSRRETLTFANGAAAESFTQGFDAYDELGNLTSLSYPQCTWAARCPGPTSRTVGFTFTKGRVTSVPGFANAVTYHPNHLVASVVHANGVTVTQANDDWSRPRPKSIATTGAMNSTGTAAANWTTGNYLYDGQSNVIHQGSARYLYDNLSRLASARFPLALDGNGAADQSQSTTYDVRGNLLSLTTNGTTLATPTTAATNRLSGAVAYDNAGNLVQWNANTYAYDRLGKMWRMKAGALEVVYFYTADDERIWSWSLTENRSTWTLRDLAGKVLTEFGRNRGIWSVQRDYVYREGQLLAALTPTGTHHFHLDHLGTPRLITTDGGRQVAFHTYFPFGQEATPPTLDAERMKFTGHERDLNAVTGANPAADDLDYMHARFFQPQTGRFLSVDPGRDWDPAVPQSWNLYAYSRNNPVRFVDPDGEAIETGWDVANIGIGIGSLVSNAAVGNWGGALVDLAGVVVDVAATAVPGVPGGAGAIIKAARAGDAATTVVRTADRAGDAVRVTGQALRKMRTEFDSVAKPRFWKNEAASNAAKYSPEDLARMKQGKGPMGPDGFPMEIHHRVPLEQGGSNSADNLIPLSRTDHRLGPNYRLNHPRPGKDSDRMPGLRGK